MRRADRSIPAAPPSDPAGTAQPPGGSLGGTWLVNALLALLGGVLVCAVASVPLAPRDQAGFAAVTLLLALAAGRWRGRQTTLLLMALSLTVSLRYLVWRATETLPQSGWPEQVLAGGLLLAEFYAVAMLLLGYLQTAWPLGRAPVPLPDDTALWPSVDVFIPTYDEPLSVVRATVLAALDMDWPQEKRAVYLLDDGDRPAFSDFAKAAGCIYLSRAGRAHAKAGNLNAALRRSGGDYVAVLDCDHIPTRAFLQLTLGWLVARPRMAVVQTAQHFYAPDAFQRNLPGGMLVAPESAMFHGLLQDGADFWGAAYFSGTGAVLRRAALEDIGGFSVDSLTEDAHTALRLHRQGWDSAYLNAPLSAGLAPARIDGLIRQRRRWMRGMVQILRRDSPLFGRGLSLAQRLCYWRAAAHFLFPLPRIAFLTAPLAYLLLGQSVIAAAPMAVLSYAVPHLLHGVMAASAAQRQWRQSFWGGLYETVLALATLPALLGTLLTPRRARRFDVTAKAATPSAGGWNRRAVLPNVLLALLLAVGLLRGGVALAMQPGPLAGEALVMNLVWAAISLIVVLAALAAGRDAPQTGGAAWIAASVPVQVALRDGTLLDGVAEVLSLDGGGIAVPPLPGGFEDTALDILVSLGGEQLVLPARIERWDGSGLRVRWQPATLDEEAQVVRAVFGRADAWSDWAAGQVDQPVVGLWRMLKAAAGVVRRPKPMAAPVALLAALALLAAGPAAAQTTTTPPKQKAPQSGVTVRVIPQAVSPQVATPAPVQPVQAAPLPSTPAPSAPAPSAPAPATPAPATTSAAPATPPAPPPEVVKPPTRNAVLTLRQLGAAGPLVLNGTTPLRGVEFGVRADEVVTAAQLSLNGAMSPLLLPDESNITVTLNGQFAGSVPARREQQSFVIDLPVSPVFFQDNNRLAFRFAGRLPGACTDPLSQQLWATVNESSTLTLTLERLPPQRDLARLPQPFFEAFQKEALVLPFVLPANAGNEALRAAGIAASWFGQLAGARGARFPVRSDMPADSNAVLLVVGNDGRDVPGVPPVTGPMLAVIPNPADKLSSLLVIAGRNGEEAVAAASALALGSRALGGASMAVQPPQAAPRRPYDAPAWIPTDRPVKLGELADAGQLQITGYTGTVRVPFRTAPDFYQWRGRSFDLDLRYAAPPGAMIDLAPSRLDVGLSGRYLDTLSLAPQEGGSMLSRWLGGGGQTAARVAVPASGVAGANELQFVFDARPLRHADCAPVPQNLRMAVDPDSTIDLSSEYRFTELPDLAAFASVGFPFTRMADLSETAVVLPDRPSGIELGAYLNLMGRFGALTGYPVTRVAVTRPDGAAALGERDLLLLGTLPHMQAAGPLLARAAVQLDGAKLSLSLGSALDPLHRLFADAPDGQRDKAAAAISAGVTESTALVAGGESPLRAGRSVVAVLAGSPLALEGAVAALRDTAQPPQIQGDLALLSGGAVTSYRVAAPYAVGTLPVWLWPSWYLRGQPLGLLVVALLGCVVLARAAFGLLRRRGAAKLPPG